MFKNVPYDKLSDEVLMARITSGNAQAFNTLYTRYSQRMHAFFSRMLGFNSEKADDFLQELFMKIIEKPEAFDCSRKFSTWLYTVAGNMCKNEYRRMERHPQTNQIPEEPGEDSIPDRIDFALFRTELQEALARLSPEHRECFVLRYQEELSTKEISEIMDCPEGTVRSRLFYALRRLADQLKIFEIK